MMATCMMLAGVDGGPRALVTPVKATRLGLGLIKTTIYVASNISLVLVLMFTCMSKSTLMMALEYLIYLQIIKEPYFAKL